MKMNKTRITSMTVFLMLSATTALMARTVTVTNTHNDGKGSLREAICLANACGKLTVIKFDIPKRDSGYDTCTCTWRITPREELPVITAPLIIDGSTQRGAYTNSNLPRQADNACIKIELSGPGVTNGNPFQGRRGLILGEGSDCSQIKGLSINSWAIGIEIQSKKSSIKGCFIGLKPDGFTPCANIISLLVGEGAKRTWIGTDRYADRNLIYGLGYQSPEALLGALTILGHDTKVEGTTVGLTAAGFVVTSDTPAQPLVGVALSSSTNTIIGTSAGAFSTVTISGHQINVAVSNGVCTLIQNTHIGTDFCGKETKNAGGTGLLLTESFREDRINEKAETENTTLKNLLIAGHSGNGIHIINALDTVVLASNVTHNGLHGICIEAAPLRTRIEDSTLSFNGLDGLNFIPPCSQVAARSDAALEGFGVFISGVTSVNCSGNTIS